MKRSNRRSILISIWGLPYPLRSTGLSLRYLPIIQHMSARHDVDLMVVNDAPDIPTDLGNLRDICRDVFLLPNPKYASTGLLSKWITRFSPLLPWTLPNCLTFPGGRLLVSQVKSLIGSKRYDCLLCAGSRTYPYMAAVSANRTIIDFVDSLYLAMRRQVTGEYGYPFLHRYECWKCRYWEARFMRTADASIFISDAGAKAVPSRMISGSDCHVIPNGISMESYTSRRQQGIRSPSIGFLGNMGYYPNIEAVHWLYDQVFKPLRTRFPALSLYVVGRNPVESISLLGHHPGVSITGSVDDIWPYLNAMDLVVLPIWRGTGMKNKVLEAMFARRPLITTPIGNEGIDASHGRHLLVCESAEEFQKSITELLTKKDIATKMGEAGHRYVQDRFSWKPISEALERVVFPDAFHEKASSREWKSHTERLPV